MQHNSFFQRNTIKEFAVEHHSAIRQKSKRSFSVTALKLNPNKFQHREVFDNRIYDKINFMKLDIKQLKQKEQQKKYTPFGELNKLGEKLNEMLEDEGIVQSLSNFHNHCALMFKHEVRKDFIKTINHIVTSLLQKIQTKVGEIASVKKKNQQKMTQYQSKLRQTMQNFTQSRKSTRKLQKEKDLQQKINQLDFALKKEMLKVDQLQQKLRDQSTLNVSLAQSIKTMQIEKNAQTAYRQSMEYKVKRLKQELQVAHIIKQQNLADKMKYIMNW